MLNGAVIQNYFDAHIIFRYDVIIEKVNYYLHALLPTVNI